MTTPEETYRRGSVVLRGDQIPRLTADASLLQTEHSADWKHTGPLACSADPVRVRRRV